MLTKNQINTRSLRFCAQMGTYKDSTKLFQDSCANAVDLAKINALMTILRLVC